MFKALLALLMIGGGSAKAGTLRVIDGDGFYLGGREIRLWGIDAPELPQECFDRVGGSYPCGTRSKRFLGQILGVSAPVCVTVTRDRYGRHVSRCTVEGLDVAAMMVRNGWALDYPRYSGGAYHRNQIAAQQEKLGLWEGDFALPWHWRRTRK